MSTTRPWLEVRANGIIHRHLLRTTNPVEVRQAIRAIGSMSANNRRAAQRAYLATITDSSRRRRSSNGEVRSYHEGVLVNVKQPPKPTRSRGGRRVRRDVEVRDFQWS